MKHLSKWQRLQVGALGAAQEAIRHQLQAQEQLQALQNEGLQHQLLTLQQQVRLSNALTEHIVGISGLRPLTVLRAFDCTLLMQACEKAEEEQHVQEAPMSQLATVRLDHILSTQT